VLLREPTKWLIDYDRLGAASALPEYPWPAVQLLGLPLRIGIPTILHYYAVMALSLLIVDAAAAGMLWRAGGRHFSRGLWVWLLFFPALGPLMVTRFDLVPAALAVAALLALSSGRALSAGGLAALGAAVKLWPALAMPAMLVPADRRSRVRSVAGFGVVVGVAALFTVAFAGAGRLWSPLALQAQRGLQIESFAALPFLWLRYLSPGGAWAVQPNDLCNCHELVGPGVPQALALAGFATFAVAAGVLAVHVRAFFAPSATRNAGVAALLAALMLVAWLVTARVFSPQYMVWLAAPLAALGVLPGKGLRRGDVALFVVACLLTHLVFPLGYEPLIQEGHLLQGPALAILTLRDSLVLVLGVRLVLEAASALRVQ
jgi:hypothetical protein